MSHRFICLDHVPEGLLELPSTQLHSRLNGACLIHLEGENTNPLFVSVLQHGNEYTGWDAVRGLLKRYQNRLPRSLYLFIANPGAAARLRRRLDGAPDLNRCWPGGTANNAESLALQELTQMMRDVHPIASVDIHNNSGKNPPYAAINRLTPEVIALAESFDSNIIYFTSPAGTQSAAFANFCPAVTLECGQAGDQVGLKRAFHYLEQLLFHPPAPTPTESARIFEMHIRITVEPWAKVSIGGRGDISLRSDLERFNFHKLDAGFAFGTQPHSRLALRAWDNDNNDVTDQYLWVQDHELQLRQPGIPAMLTMDPRIMRQDCLGYIMRSRKTDSL